MRYFALAADYDGTVATSGTLSHEVEAALERLRSSGRRAVLVTGRTFEELSSHRPNLDLFDSVVLGRLVARGDDIAEERHRHVLAELR